MQAKCPSSWWSERHRRRCSTLTSMVGCRLKSTLATVRVRAAYVRQGCWHGSGETFRRLVQRRAVQSNFIRGAGIVCSLTSPCYSTCNSSNSSCSMDQFQTNASACVGEHGLPLVGSHLCMGSVWRCLLTTQLLASIQGRVGGCSS